MPERSVRITAAVVFAFALAAFWPATGFPLLRWDDGPNILDNEFLRFTKDGLVWMFTGAKLGHWQPLTWLSLALDRAVYGEKTFGIHLTSILIHSVNAVLMYLLGRKLLKDETKGKPEFAAALAALLWALHPLRVESVAWVTERRDVLGGFFSLLAALSYVDGKRNRALALSVLAMMSKVFAVVLPLVWLLLDFRLEGKVRWKEKLFYVPVMFVVLVMNISAQNQSAAVPWSAFGLSPRLAQCFYNLAFYPWKTVLPTGLAPLYELSFLLQAHLFTVSFCLVAVSALLIALAGRRSLSHAALGYAILLLPALGLFKSGRMAAADRWSYLPAIPLSYLAAVLIAGLPVPARRGLGLALVLALGVLTRRQLPVWSSDLALWTRAAEASPLSWFALDRRAEAEDAAGQFGAAADTRQASMELRRAVLERAAEAYAVRGEAARAEEMKARAAGGP